MEIINYQLSITNCQLSCLAFPTARGRRWGLLAGIFAILLIASSAGAQSGMRSVIERQSRPSPDALRRVGRSSSFSPGDYQSFIRRGVWIASVAVSLARRSAPDADQERRLHRDAVFSPDDLRRLDARSEYSQAASRRIETSSHAASDRVLQPAGPADVNRYLSRNSIPAREETAVISRFSTQPSVHAHLVRCALPAPSLLAQYRRRSVMSDGERRVFRSLSLD